MGTLSGYISDPMELIKISLFAREPLLLRLVKEDTTFESFLRGLSLILKDVVPALIGEIFFEESRELTSRYEAVLKAIAVGNSTPSRVASYVSGILGGGFSSSDVKSYMRILEKMGLIRRTKIFRRDRYVYMIDTPMIHTYYYLNEEIGYGEMEVPFRIVIEEIDKLIPRYFEDFMVSFIAEVLGGVVEKVYRDEIDGVISHKKKILAVVEVKMEEITPSEIKAFIEKTKRLGIKAPRIVIAREKTYQEDIISLDFHDIIRIAEKPETLLAMLYGQ